jgi:ABC-type branched-subunit amino acid transport system substrate-binding protein
MPFQRIDGTAQGSLAAVSPARSRSLRVGIVLAAALLLSLLVAAWNSSSSSASVARSSASSAPIKIGFFSILTGADELYPDAQAGAKAAVRGINARGGINGHKVVLETCDVQSNVDIAEQCARTFVSDHVVASVGNLDNYGPEETPILQAAKIPIVGDESLDSSTQYNSPVEFPYSSGFVGEFAAGSYYGLKVLKPAQKSYAFVGLQIPVVGALEASVESTVKKQGGTWDGFISMPETTTAFAPYVAAVMAKHPQIVYLGMSGAQGAEFALAAEAAGAKFRIFHTAQAYPPATLASLGPKTAFAKSILFDSDVPAASATSEFPALKTFNSDIAAEYKAGDSYAGPKYRSIAQEEVWYSFHAAFAVAANIKGQITAASMLAELRTAKNLNIGLQSPWTPNASGPKGYTRVSNWQEYMLKESGGTFGLASAKSFSVESFVTGQ